MSTAENVIYYKRPDGVVGVGFFIPYGGEFVHSIAWPDRQAERYTVDRLARCGIDCDGMTLDSLTDEAAEFLKSDHGWRFLTPEEVGETKAELAKALGIAPGELFVPQGETHEAGEETGREAFYTSVDAAAVADAGVDSVDTGNQPSDQDQAAKSVAESVPAGVGGDEAGEDAAAVDADQDGSEADEDPAEQPQRQVVSEAQSIRDYLTANPGAENKQVIESLKAEGIDVNSSQVNRQRKNLAKG